MRARLAALALAVCLGAGCGDDTAPAIEVPDELAAKAQRPDAYVKPFGAAVRVDAAADDEAYLRAFVTHFTSLTPENEMKWVVIHPEEDRFAWNKADELMDLARATGKRVRGHPLVWDEQLPEWVTEGDWDRSELAAALREHVTALVRRYRGRVAEWDVVNEPLGSRGGLARNVFQRVLGERYIDVAFRAARAADPAAKLFLNEYGAELAGPKAVGLLRLVHRLKQRGVPIDAVGFQNHVSASAFPTREDLLGAFVPYTRLGLSVAVTEMDVTLDGHGLARQAAAYQGAAAACRDAPNCTGFTVWGVTDRYSWRDEEQRPLLFDSDGAPKPALAAVLEVLGR